MPYENILTETRGRVGIVTLNRPRQLNALNDALMDELGHALRAFDDDDAIGAIVITGSERAFAAGADVSAMAERGYMDVYKTQFITRNWETIRLVRKPVIAQRLAADDFAMMCDSSSPPKPRNSDSRDQAGIIPGAGGTQRFHAPSARRRRWTWYLPDA